MSELITKSSEASRGGYQAVKRVEGTLASVKRVPSRFGDGESKFGPAKDQAEVVLEDAIILEMDEGEPEPELRDNKFTFWMGYAPPGKPKPHQNTFYVKGFLKSAEVVAGAQGIKDGGLDALMNTRVVLERKVVVLFKRPTADNPDAKEEITQEGFTFVDDRTVAVDIKDYVKSLVIGKTPPNALRTLATDHRTRQFPEYREALRNDSFAQLVGLAVGSDGKFAEVTEVTDVPSVTDVTTGADAAAS